MGGDILVEADSVAVIVEQWYVSKATLREHRKDIAGYSGNQTFKGLTDIVGHGNVKNVRQKLRNDNPGQLILEYVTGMDLGSHVPTSLWIPSTLPCPEGTIGWPAQP